MIDAFDTLAHTHPHLKLIMTGVGSKERMKILMRRIGISHAKSRIEYKGYVSDDECYEILKTLDIPCMS